MPGLNEGRGIRMTRLIFAMLFTAGLAVSGCYGPGRYPVTGTECGPDDPVKDINVPACT